jgi:cytochrome P450
LTLVFSLAGTDRDFFPVLYQRKLMSSLSSSFFPICLSSRLWAYFPFGGGPRICIGMPFAQLEAKLLLATILQNYTPRLVPGFPVQLQQLVTLRPKGGLRMVVEPTKMVVKDDRPVKV